MSRVTEADVLPFLGRNSRIEGGFVVTPAGNAWKLNEYLVQRRYRTKPEVKARYQAAHRRWADAHREHLRAYGREWMRRKRAAA